MIEAGFDEVGSLIERGRIRAALGEAMRLSSEVNQYVCDTAPWALVKTDRDRAGTVLYVALARGRQPQDHLHAVPAAHLADACTSCSATRAGSRARSSSATSTEENGQTHAGAHRRLLRAGSAPGQPSELPPGQALRSRDRSSVKLEHDDRRGRPRRRMIDTHAHLEPSEAHEVLDRAREAGVARVVIVATTHRRGSRRARARRGATTASTPRSASIPHNAGGDDAHAASTSCASCSRDDRAVAVGETGLDYFRDYAPRDAQRRLFDGAARDRRRARQAGRHPHPRRRRGHARGARGLRRNGHPPLLLLAGSPRAGARARLVRLVRRQRHLPEGAGAARGGAARACGPAARRDRQPVPRAAGRSRPAQRARLRDAHARRARGGAR